MKKKLRKLTLNKETLRNVHGGDGPASDAWFCTIIGQCESVPPRCPSNWITHCGVNTATGVTCAVSGCKTKG